MFAIFSHEELLTLIYYKMVSYKELGLVNTKEMFAKAIKGGYAFRFQLYNRTVTGYYQGFC